MKLYFQILIVLLNISLLHGANYNKVDNQSATVPDNLKTASEIAVYLTRNLTSDTDKARAIYYWITHNISYNVSLLNNVNQSYILGQKDFVNEALHDRKGVCQHYSSLFDACCKAVGLQSYIIPGYTGTDGKIAEFSHSWNGIKIDGNYFLIDATWAAGTVSNGKFKQKFDDSYFLISPQQFIKTHIPFDPVWQFLDNPLTHKEFEKGDFSKLKTRSGFNYADSINAMVRMDSLSLLQHQNYRVREFGISNDLVRNYVVCNQQNIIQIKYEQAAKIFNKGISEFNNYIMLKNKQFNNLKIPDNDLLDLLASSRKKIEDAENRVRFLNSDDRDVNRNLAKMQDSLKTIKESLNEEDQFMKKYISTWKPLRIFLFYKSKQ